MYKVGDRVRFPIIVGMVLILSLSLVSAQVGSFDTETLPVRDRIAVNETAEFDVTIINKYNNEREFKIHKAGYPFWDLMVKPLQNPITVTVRPDSQETIRLFVRPLHITQVDTYIVDSQVEDLRTGTKKRLPLTIGIQSNEGIIDGYVPTVLASMKMPDSVDPRNPGQLEITMDNQNPLDFPDVTVVVSSDTFKGEYHYPLGPKETKTVHIPLQMDALTQPTNDRITVTLFRDGKSLVKPLVKDFSIESYSTTQDSEVTGQFLKSQYTISVESNDPEHKATIKREVGFFEKLFTTARPDPTRSVREDGARYLVWEVGVENNQAQIVVTENYRPLIIILLLLAVLLGLYYVFRSPLVLIKEVASVSGREGGVTSVKIVLKLRNRGKEALHQVEVGDVIPQIAGLKKELTIGTLQPEKITRSHEKGTIVKWVVDSLEPNEGVVLSYRMHSKLSILGDFSLPTATARFKNRNAYVVTNSNRTIVNE